MAQPIWRESKNLPDGHESGLFVDVTAYVASRNNGERNQSEHHQHQRYTHSESDAQAKPGAGTAM